MKPDAFRILLLLAPLLAAGCGTVQTIPVYEVPVVPAPVTSLPPVPPALVRLPVVVTFPSGGGVDQHFVNLLKGGIKQMAQGIVLKSKLKGLWDSMEKPVFLDKDIWLLVRPESMAIGKGRGDLRLASTLHPVLEMTANPEILFGAPTPGHSGHHAPAPALPAGAGHFPGDEQYPHYLRGGQPDFPGPPGEADRHGVERDGTKAHPGRAPAVRLGGPGDCGSEAEL